MAPNTLVGEYIIPASCTTIKGGDSPDKSPFLFCRDNITSISTERGSLLSDVCFYCFANSALVSCDLSECTKLLNINCAMFSGCTKLSSVKLPPNCEALNAGCFKDTKALTKLDLPDTVRTIAGYHPVYYKVFSNSGLRELKINPTSNLRSIRTDCFADSNLEYFYFPEFCTDVSFSAFQGCPIIEFSIHKNNNKYKTDGTSIFIGNNNETLLFVSSAFTGTYSVPSFVTKIESSAIRGCSLSGCHIGSQVTSVGSWVLSASKITEFSFPPQMTTVVEYMFFNCYYLTTVTFTDAIVRIERMAFQSCSALRNLVLPSKLKSIRDGAFAQCFSLRTLTIPATCDQFGDGVFKEISITINSLNPEIQIDNYVMYKNNRQTITAYLGSNASSSIKINSSCTLIGTGAFQLKLLSHVTFDNNEMINISSYAFSSSTIKSITFPSGLMKMEQYAFSNCQNLTSVVFQGSQITAIPDYCFYQCPLLSRIVFPSSITSIGESAFRESPKIGDIGITNLNSLSSIGTYAFYQSGLTTADISSQSHTVGTQAFAQSKLESLTIACNISQQLCQSCASYEYRC
ncbi:surface antigen BspA-like [Trichomonas vaginalis G3]|uniref:Surface antigen BspA-like n=1 Tax=Trichomonas vaginalis (strain ATCC PRA-98 / G3) TaxID=412133 RepID=A2E5P1_TRIV3|nr:protein ubiquitination [Trichomonas vaginalis G3]EAY12082.1 surface antigen BspA-like [Trichomonas vaginalis G3]KAI5553189.1 protein ubiquitination [Trichomonas vaginalis G3]|eukprot:XP_001324305.1 surface antigen BspA-like [Trichomonas vaginalis G3]